MPDLSKDTEIRIMAVGDIMLGMAYPNSIAQDDNIPNRLSSNSNSLIDKKVRDIFKKSDIVFGNLECVISKEFVGKKRNSFTDFPDLIMAPPEAINFLEDNFSHLNIANNHILDHGLNKAEETVKFLEDSNIIYIGKPKFWNSNFTKTTIKGKKIGFTGFSLYVPDKKAGKNLSEYRTKKEFSGLDNEIPYKYELKKNIIRDIREKRNKVDILLVSLHWGIPQTLFPSVDQIKFGRKLIDEGADIVLGHGPHIFHPVEIYKGKVIAYSLGNFIFDMWREKNLKSGILEFKINDSVQVDIVPIVQRDSRVYIDKEIDGVEDMIVEDITKVYQVDEFKKKNNKFRRGHYKGFVWQYIKNSYNLPLAYHKYVLSNWAFKAYNKIFGKR